MNIQFLGAAHEVTGSCYLIQCGTKKILIDCGLIQGSHQNEERNRESFAFDPKKIDAVVLTHAHIDHSGRLPLLVKQGFTGPIYTHRATRDLCEIMLLDSAAISEKEAFYAKKRGHPEALPLYTIEDVAPTLEQFNTLEYNQTKAILQGVQIRLQNAGHILGAAIIEIWLTEKDLKRKLVFSGDLGNENMTILHDPTLIDNTDLLILESTYGNRLHKSNEESLKEFGAILKDAIHNTGNILIPAFSIGRTQEILYAFHEHFDQWNLSAMQIFVDSPMAIKATKVYEHHWKLYNNTAKANVYHHGSLYKLPNLRLTDSTQASMEINRISSGAIIIAGSGMCNGGRIKHHLEYNLWRNNSHVIFVGYQAKGTLGRALVDGKKEVTLWGKSVKVNAKIHTITGFSAHADQAQLLRWCDHFKNNPLVILTHGESESMEGLTTALYEQHKIKSIAPQLGDILDLKNLK